MEKWVAQSKNSPSSKTTSRTNERKSFKLEVRHARSKPKANAYAITASILVGLEYECVYGHRSILHAPESNVKHRWPGTNCKIYSLCVDCPTASPSHAQLIRIYISLPKQLNLNVVFSPSVMVQYTSLPNINACFSSVKEMNFHELCLASRLKCVYHQMHLSAFDCQEFIINTKTSLFYFIN